METNDELNFPLFNDELYLSEEHREYAKMDGFFLNLATSARQDFRKVYNSMGNMDTLVNSCVDKTIEIYRRKAELCVKYLVNRGIYKYTEKDFIRTDYFVEYFEQLIDAYVSILSDQKEKERYRQIRKQMRGKMVGVSWGGGISGAVKASIQAGAVNAVTGMAHSAVNSVGNMFSAAGAAVNKSSMYHNTDTRENLEKAVFMDIYTGSALMFVYLYKEGIQIFGPTDEDKNMAMRIFENLKKFPINQDSNKAYEMAFQMFNLDPFEAEYYDYCIRRFPKEQDKLLNIAFYLEVVLTNYAESILMSIFNSYTSDTEKEATSLRIKILSYQKRLGVEKSQALNTVDEKLKKFDIEARTFNGKLYDTRKLKQEVEEDFNELGKVYVDIENTSELECNSMKSRLLQEKDKHYPDAFQIYMDKIEKHINEIWKEEDRSILDNIFLKTNIYDEASIQHSISEIEKIGRTEDKEQYINALKAFTEKNLEKVKKNIVLVKPVILVSMLILSISLFMMGLWPFTILLIVILIILISKQGNAEELWKQMTLNETLIHPELTMIKDKVDKARK
jgi:hypothetical protein